MKKFFLVCSLMVFLFVSNTPKANAISFGDAALTVGISTVAGGILGVSTLPFYPNMADHTKNVYYGAAMGAVVGVMLCAYAGFSEGRTAEEEADADQQALLQLKSTQELGPVKLAALTRSASPDLVLAWAPIVQVRW